MEREIVHLTSSGLVESGVAFMLKANRDMIERAMARIAKKVGARDTAELVQWARNGKFDDL